MDHKREVEPPVDPLQTAMLAELRAAHIRARLLQADIEALGIALRHGLITAAQALVALHDLGMPTMLDVGSRPGDTWAMRELPNVK